MPKKVEDLKGTKPSRKPTQSGLNRAMRRTHNQKGKTTFEGQHSKAVFRSAARAIKARQRTEQMLTHLATALKEAYTALTQKSEIEIQIALVNDSLWLISSNSNATAEAFYDNLVDGAVHNVAQQMQWYADLANTRARKSKGVEAHRIRRHSGKVAQELGGLRHVESQIELASAVNNLHREGAEACLKVDANDADDIESFIELFKGNRDETVVLFTDSSGKVHAEQKILKAFCKAYPHLGTNFKAIFAGTFRPCRGCYESLRVVQKYYLQGIEFGSRPGHYWDTTSKCHTEILNLLLNHRLLTEQQVRDDFSSDFLLTGEPTETYRMMLRLNSSGKTQEALHYATDSESEGEED